MLDQSKPVSASPATVPSSSKPKKTGYEPRSEAAERGSYRELKAFALIVGLCLIAMIIYELTTSG